MKQTNIISLVSIKTLGLILIFFISYLGFLPIKTTEAKVKIDGIITENEYSQHKIWDNGNFELHWQIDGENVLIGMKAKTKGWLSLGISPTVMMKDADMIIAWVEPDGKTKLFDAYSIGEFGPHPLDEQLGGTNDITLFAGTETDEYTTVEFQRKLDTGDSYDKPFPRSGILKIIVAYGSRDEFTSMHRFRAADTILIDEKKEEKKYTDLSASDAKKLYDNEPSLLILDVSSAWKNGHLPGAVNIEFNQVAQNLEKLSKNRPILVYCHGDAPAIFVADLLGKNGFERVYRLLGNYGAWTKAGFKIEKYKEVTQVKFQIDSSRYWVDDMEKTMDTQAMIIEGRTMLPIRFLAEALGARVTWKADTQEVSIYLQLIQVQLQINQSQAKVNGGMVPIDPSNNKVKPLIVPPGRTMLPLRFVAESLQCTVEWDGAKREALISWKQ